MGAAKAGVRVAVVRDERDCGGEEEHRCGRRDVRTWGLRLDRGLGQSPSRGINGCDPLVSGGSPQHPIEGDTDR